MMLSLGFFTFVSLFEMIFSWLGVIGAGAFVLILFPLQLVSSGLLYPREILPAFYTAIGDYLPATYFASGVMKTTYGATSLGGDFGILALMAGIFVVVTALALFKKNSGSSVPVKA
jgi:uncharacterized phage infection (PIP) family protein YhgE